MGYSCGCGIWCPRTFGVVFRRASSMTSVGWKFFRGTKAFLNSNAPAETPPSLLSHGDKK